MIVKKGRFYYLCCDGNCKFTHKFLSFDELSIYKQKKGWCAIKRNLKWYDLCLECREKIDNKEVDLNE